MKINALIYCIILAFSSTASAQPAGFVPALWTTGSGTCAGGTQTATFAHTSIANDLGDLVDFSPNGNTGTITFTGGGGLVWAGSTAQSHMPNGGGGTADAAEGFRLSAPGTTITAVDLGGAYAAFGTDGAGTFTVDFLGGLGTHYISDSTPWTAVTDGPVPSATATVVTSFNGTAQGVQVKYDDCDEDGESSSTDPDDFNACVRTGLAAPTVVGSGALVTLIPGGIAGGGSLGDLDCDADGAIASADTSDADPCITPAADPGLNVPGGTPGDCDDDGTATGADTNDADACIMPAYDPAIMIPGGTADDCDDDGVLGSAGDPDDADPCNPNACADAGATLSSLDQSRSAMRALGSVHDHMNYRMATSGKHHDEYLLSFSAGEAGARTEGGARWTAAGVSFIDRPNGASGSGVFAYGLAGWDLAQSSSSIAGVHIGAEYGDWQYDTESDVEKIGLSGGVYGAQKLGDGLLLSGTLTYTHFFNNIKNDMGQTADYQSDRLIGSVRLEGTVKTDAGMAFTPFVDVNYAFEQQSGYTYSGGGQTFGTTTAEVGDVGVGVEIVGPYNDDIGQFYGRLEANQAFGEGDVTLSDGSILSANEDVTGSVSLGWTSNTGYDSIATVEVSVGDIGNDDREEVRVDAHWERNY